MGIQRLIKRSLDTVLAPMGMQLVRVSQDFDSRPTGHAKDRMFNALAEAFDTWGASARVWPVEPLSETRSIVAAFYDQYIASPFRGQSGGSRFNNLLWLHLLALATRPSLIIDSGTYRGASAWAFASALPQCPIFSFDIDLSHVALRCPGVTYAQQDWAVCDFADRDLGNALAYFDDHVDQAARLAEAADRGVARIVFDDDFPVTSFAAMAHDGKALPKIEFILDEDLGETHELTWVSNGRNFRWPVDRAALALLRARIAATERLPNTSLITGIHQTPYRLVRVGAAGRAA